MNVDTTVPAEPTVTLTMSVEEFRLLDAVQYYYLGGGTDGCLTVNDGFREARNMLGVVPLPKIEKDQGFGIYFDAAASQVKEELPDS